MLLQLGYDVIGAAYEFCNMLGVWNDRRSLSTKPELVFGDAEIDALELQCWLTRLFQGSISADYFSRFFDRSRQSVVNGYDIRYSASNEKYLVPLL